MAETKFDKLKKEAKKLGIPFAEDVKQEVLESLIADKKAAEIEERARLQEAELLAESQKESSVIVLKNVFGDDVDQDDYFFEGKNAKGEVAGGAPSYFNKLCGMPVDREDMLVVFNRIFKPKYNFLFYKARDRELYFIIVPIKYSSIIGGSNESLPHDFQRHAISFIGEGSVNLESLRMKLERVSSTIRINE